MKIVRILGIESSCDETAAAIIAVEVTDDNLNSCSNNHSDGYDFHNDLDSRIKSKSILSNVIYSQVFEHKNFNGVVPEIAARSHLEKIDVVVRKALDDAAVDIDDLDAIAGTCGPGLIGGVIVGANFAKGISLATDLPFIAVNHIEAHALTVRLTDDDIRFPYLLLLVSGGHCQICIVHSCDSFEIIGQTLDDSVGESFDKVAKMLGLGYPGGPALEKCAYGGDEKRFDFPKPLCYRGCLDLSFSGLKTAVRVAIEKSEIHDDNFKSDISSSFQRTVADILTYKMNSAITYCKNKGVNPSAVVMAGGVAANKFIRDCFNNLCNKHALRFAVPPIDLCTDNGAMIAWMGMEKFLKHQFAKLDFKPRPKWALGE